MKSIKKRFKQLLAEIDRSAQTLLVLSADLDLFSEIHQTGERIAEACAALSEQASNLKKVEFRDGIAGAEALSQLEEFVDTDAISALEDRLFAALENQAEDSIGEFLQQLLEKFDRHYSAMVENIQQLSALLDEE